MTKEMDLQLKVMSLNCWGIPVISKFKSQRFEAISNFLTTCSYDLISLQEVWVRADYKTIKDKVRHVLPYSHYFSSGVFGSGICIFSKYPFLEVYFHQWAINGYMHKILHGDWFGGKGVGLCRLNINGVNVNVYCTHLHAKYNNDNDEYIAHRILQAYDAAQFIRLTSYNADLVILGGDLNTEPDDIPYRIFIHAAGLKDSYIEAVRQPELFGTNQCSYNTFTGSAKDIMEIRIDYIMYRNAQNYRVTVQNYCHPLPKKVQNESFSYSDHEAICSTLELHKNDNTTDRQETNIEPVLKESVAIFDQALNKLNSQKWIYWFGTVFILFALLSTMEFSAPIRFVILYHSVRILFTGIFFFTLIMATLWNRIESNAILAGKLAMLVELKNLPNKKND